MGDLIGKMLQSVLIAHKWLINKSVGHYSWISFLYVFVCVLWIVYKPEMSVLSKGIRTFARIRQMLECGCSTRTHKPEARGEPPAQSRERHPRPIPLFLWHGCGLPQPQKGEAMTREWYSSPKAFQSLRAGRARLSTVPLVM